MPGGEREIEVVCKTISMCVCTDSFSLVIFWACGGFEKSRF